MVESAHSQGLYDEHWQEVTHKANATLGEAVGGIHELLGEVVQQLVQF